MAVFDQCPAQGALPFAAKCDIRYVSDTFLHACNLCLTQCGMTFMGRESGE